MSIGVILILLMSSNSASAADHQGGQIRVRWSTSDLYLNSQNYLEQEFTPTVTTSFQDGASFRWTNQYHFDFCWQGNGSLTNTGNRCGYVGFGLGQKSGSNYVGNFDFAIFNAIEIQKYTNDNQVYCNNSADAGYVGNTKTYYMNCWHPIVIQMNTTYILRVQNDKNSDSDFNWWSATLINKKTNESVTIGKIKAIANNINEQLTSLETVVFYAGDASKCDDVPIIDLFVTPIRNQNLNSKFLNYWNAECIKAVAVKSVQNSSLTSIRLGGANPISREIGYIENSSSPSPTSTTTSKISEVTNTKPIKPTLDLISITGNKINLTVNLNVDNSPPDRIYLISPNLSVNSQEKIYGEISNNKGVWTLNFDPSASTRKADFSIISVRNGLESEPLKFDYTLPASLVNQSNSISKIPGKPSNLKVRVVGTDLVISTDVTSGNRATESIYLYSPELGISKNKANKGDLLGSTAVFTVPMKSSYFGKVFKYYVYAENRIGKSELSTGKLQIPSQKTPTYTPPQNQVKTITCSKGSILRTFAADSCPPGWNNK